MMWFSSLSKYTCIKVGFLLLFTLVNVVLYKQSKHAFLWAILPHLGINPPVNLTTYVNISTATNHSFRPLTNTLKLNISTVTSNSISTLTYKSKFNSYTYGVKDLTTRVYEVQKSKQKKLFFGERIVNPHDFPYIIQPNVSCNKVDVELVICVPISHDNYQGRKVIRITWGSYAYNISNKAILVFFLGTKLTSPDKPQTDKQDNVSAESSQYGDIVQEDFVDSYNNLSLKSVSILKWVSSFCYNAKFILKVDDDMYVNIPFLVKTLREYDSGKSFQSAYIIGSVQEHAQPIRNPSSKWYTPISLFKESTYPKYVSGTAYTMTTEAAYLLYEASLRLHTFWLEDVYITGLCARKAAVHIYNNGYFTYGKPAVSGCSFLHHISGHRYNHEEIISIHKQLYDPNIKC